MNGHNYFAWNSYNELKHLHQILGSRPRYHKEETKRVRGGYVCGYCGEKITTKQANKI